MENQGTKEDDSQIDRHPEAGIFRCQTTQNSGPEDGHDMVTGVIEETHDGHDIVTGATEQIRNRRDMVTAEQLQNRFAIVITWWQEVQKRFAMDMTWWQELKRRFAIVLTWWQQFKTRFPTARLELPQENNRRFAPQVSHTFAVKTTLPQLKQTRFCWPFSNWRRTVIQPISTTTAIESQNCLSPSRQQGPQSTGNQRNLNCLKIYSKRV